MDSSTFIEYNNSIEIVGDDVVVKYLAKSTSNNAIQLQRSKKIGNSVQVFARGFQIDLGYMSDDKVSISKPHFLSKEDGRMRS